MIIKIQTNGNKIQRMIIKVKKYDKKISEVW
jgi:hypothetical protein